MVTKQRHTIVIVVMVMKMADFVAVPNTMWYTLDLKVKCIGVAQHKMVSSTSCSFLPPTWWLSSTSLLASTTPRGWYPLTCHSTHTLPWPFTRRIQCVSHSRGNQRASNDGLRRTLPVSLSPLSIRALLSTRCSLATWWHWTIRSVLRTVTLGVCPAFVVQSNLPVVWPTKSSIDLCSYESSTCYSEAFCKSRLILHCVKNNGSVWKDRKSFDGLKRTYRTIDHEWICYKPVSNCRFSPNISRPKTIVGSPPPFRVANDWPFPFLFMVFVS